MSTLILIFTFVAIVHFVLEFIIAPHVRQEILFESFMLREEARRGASTFGKEMPGPQYRAVRGEAEAFCHIFPRLNITTVITMNKELGHDKELRRVVQARVDELDSIKQPEARRILGRLGHLGRRAMTMNMAGWFLYLAPLILVTRCVRWVRSSVLKLLVMPRHVLDRIAPVAIDKMVV